MGKTVKSITVDVNIADAICHTVNEVESAMKNWPRFNSAHEGYAVLKEEVDELWDIVKMNQKKRNINDMYSEAIQVAAMAIRFASEVCDEINGRK